MSTGTHGDQGPAQGIHVIQAYEVANAVALAVLPVVAADIGKVARKLDDDTFHVLVSIGPSVWVDITAAGGGGGSVFGQGYHYEEKLTQQNTSSSSLVEYMTTTTPILLAGEYRIEWTVIYGYGSASQDFILAVQVDNSQEIIDPLNGGVMREEPKDPGTNQRFARSGSRDLTLTLGAHQIDMDFGASNGSAQARIYNGTLRLYRVS